jgi:hypothetical protein
MAWAQPTKAAAEPENKQSFGADYYRSLFNRKRENLAPIRMALVGKENTTKSGTALSIALAHTDKAVVVIDCDNSAANTVDYLAATDPTVADRVRVIPMVDEYDESMWNEDNTTNWLAVVEKVEWFASFIAEDAEDIGAVVFDGGSTFLKWCEFVMTERLLARGTIKSEGDSFNQKEWAERNRIFKGVLNRLTALPVPYVFFTFHLKDHQTYVDLGNGQKGLMKVGEKVDWVSGTQRFVSQQVFLRRYTQKGDKAAGVEADKDLKPGEFVVRAHIEEMKGRNSEHLGKTFDVLRVVDGEVTYTGLPLSWRDE